MFFGVDLLDVDTAILEDLCETISFSLRGIKDSDWLEEVGKGFKLLGLAERSSLGDDMPPSKGIFGSAGRLGLNRRGPTGGCTGIFAGGGKITGRPDGDVTVRSVSYCFVRGVVRGD